MKKTLSSLAVLGIFVAPIAFAGQLSNNGGTIRTIDCVTAQNAAVSQLTNNVNVILSNNVSAGYNCNTQSPTTGNNPVWIAACSSAGSQKTRTIACQVTQADPNNDGDNSDDVYNDPACTAPNTTVTGSGSATYFASSAGGSVSPSFLGTSSAAVLCSPATAETFANNKANE